MKIRKLRFLAIILSVMLVPSFLKAQESDSIKMSVELEEVEVTGQRTTAVYKQVARNISVISAADISSSPSSTLQDLLESVPFTDIRQRNLHGVQADISLRGGSFDQVMVLLNGINVTDPQTGHFNLDLPVELGSIERIEVLHGSGSRLYGANAYKGVINIITRKKDSNFRAGLDYGQHGLLHSFAAAGYSGKKFYNNISLSGNASEGFTENTDYNLKHLFYRGGYEGKKVSIDLQAGTGRKAFGANDFYSPSFPEQYEETSSGFGSISLSSKGKIRFSASGYWRRHNDHFLLKRYDPSFYRNYHRTDVYGIRMDAGFSSIFGKTFAGTELRHEGILSSSLGEAMTVPVRIAGADSMYYTRSFARNTAALFIEHNIKIKGFSFTGGFLFDINSLNSKPELFPGLDVSRQFPAMKARIFASINRSLRRPTFTDMFYRDPSNEGNTGLLPEKLIAFESGINFNLNRFEPGITFFRDNGRDVIDWVWDPSDRKYHAMNISRINTKGFELRGEYVSKGESSFGFSKAGLAYSFTDLEKSTGDFESKYSLDHLKHKLQMSVSNNISKRIRTDWIISWYSRNGSYLDYNETDKSVFSSPFRPYWLVNARVSWRGEIISVHADVSNLLDAEYTDSGSLFQPGRWITAGIRLNIPLGKE